MGTSSQTLAAVTPISISNGLVSLGAQTTVLCNQTGTPSSPPGVGQFFLYFKVNGLLYSMNHAGSESPITGGGGSSVWGDITGNIADQIDLDTILQSLQTQIDALGGATDEEDGGSGNTVNIDFSINPAWKVLLNRATTTINITGMTKGKGYLIRTTQDLVGLRSVVWDSDIVWPGNTEPQSSNRNQVDLYNFYTDGVFIYGSYVQGFPNPNAFDPTTSISGIRLWFDGNDTTTLNGGGGIVDAAQVTSWGDKSGLANDASQATSGIQPTFRVGQANGLAVLRFQNSTLTMSSGLVLAKELSPWTAVFVFKLNSFPGSNGTILNVQATTTHTYTIAVDSAGKFNTVGATSEWQPLKWDTSATMNNGKYHIAILRYVGTFPGHTNSFDLLFDGVNPSVVTSPTGFGSGNNIGSADGVNEPNFMIPMDAAMLFWYATYVQGSDLTNLVAWIQQIYGSALT